MTILQQIPLQMPWVTLDPFLFCVHHLDNYPEGDGNLGIVDSLEGRNVGSDFSGKGTVGPCIMEVPSQAFLLIPIEDLKQLPLDVKGL